MDKQEEFEFALRFMSEHPKSAVRVLEQSDVTAVAGLLTQAPVNYITPILKYMLPEFSARICRTLEPERAASILSTLDANATSIILRLVAQPDRATILAGLPAGLRKKTALLLDFPLNTVGAWMSPHMLVVANDLKNKNVIKYLKSGSSQDDCEYIYVTDRDGVFLGRTRFLDVMQNSETLPVTTSMDTSCPTLPAQMLIEQTRDHRAWEYADVLPVTNWNNHLLGILHHHLLRQGLDKMNRARQHQSTGKDPISGLFEVYGQSLLALLHTVSDAVDKDKL